MFGGSDGMRRMMGGEQLKPKNIGETLGRLGTYFKLMVCAGVRGAADFFHLDQVTNQT